MSVRLATEPEGREPNRAAREDGGEVRAREGQSIVGRVRAEDKGMVRNLNRGYRRRCWVRVSGASWEEVMCTAVRSNGVPRFLES